MAEARGVDEDEGTQGPRDRFLDEFALEGPDDSWMDRLREAETLTPLGCIGSYELLAEISRGGQGIVYRARQAGRSRALAVKRLLAGSLATASMRMRFEREVEAAASLDHPGIVSVLGMELADGQPLLAMEWINGVPVTKWAVHEDGRRRATPELVAMAIAVCEAVRHAHQRGVIHRDLKPSNILVDGAGRPHILDFGLAKFAESAGSDEPSLTLSEQFVGTVAYASPEQLRCRPEQIDVRSDIYSLGVILFEMFTDQLPQKHLHNPHEALQAIEDHGPSRPSTLSPGLDRQLDAIVLKALAPEASLRYQSVDALMADLERYQRGEPIEARGANAWHSFSTFMRRHRMAAGVSAATFVLVIAVAITMTVLYQRALAAEQLSAQRLIEAQAGAERTRAVKDYLERMFAAVDPAAAAGPEVKVRDLLDQASNWVATDLADHPDVAAEVRTVIGTTYEKLGLYEPAEIHLREALRLNRAVHGDDHASVAGSLHQLAGLLQSMGRNGEAEAPLREALAMRRKLLGNDQRGVLESLCALATLLHVTGDTAGADAIVTEAVALYHKLLDAGEALTSIDSTGLIGHLFFRGDLAGAESLLRDTVNADRRMFGDDSRVVATDLRDLAGFLGELNRFDEAEALAREALEIDRRLLGESHLGIASDLDALAVIVADRGNNAAALDLFEQSLAIRRRHLGDRHPQVAHALSGLALTLEDLGRHAEAEPLYREALSIEEAVFGADHSEAAFGHWRLGRALRGQAKLEEAASEFRAAIDLWKKHLPANHWHIAYGASDLGDCLTALNRFAEAEPLLLESYPIIREMRGEQHRRTIEARRRLVALYEAWGRPEQADAYRDK